MPLFSVRGGLRAVAAAGARHVAAAGRAAAVGRARPAARVAGAARGRLVADTTTSECTTLYYSLFSYK